MDNPYSSTGIPNGLSPNGLSPNGHSPDDLSLSPAQDSPAIQDLDWLRSQLSPSRNAIVVVSFVFGLAGSASIFSFVYCLFLFYRGVEFYAIEITPYFIAMNFIRGVGLSWISCLMWRYQRAIRNYIGAEEQNRNRFANEHNGLWISAATFQVILAAFSILSLWFA